jgi:hypothetical protein
MSNETTLQAQQKSDEIWGVTRNPICHVHKVEMQMINYSWGEIDFVCPKGHVE